MWILILFSVFESPGYSVTAMGMGGNNVAFRECELQSNQAPLSYVDKPRFSYSYNRGFNVLEKHRANISWKGFGVSILSVRTPDPEGGADLSGETVLRFGQGLKLNEELRIGYSINGYHLRMRNFGSEYAGGLDLSIQGTVYEDWTLGVNTHNINRPKMGLENAYSLPWSLSAGVSYNPYPDVVSHLAFTREMDNPLQIHLGQRFKVSEFLVLEGGLQTEPIVQSLGVEVKAGVLSFRYAVQNYRKLPLSHWIGVSYR